MTGRRPKNRLGAKSHSLVTGKKFNRQNRAIRSHGPLPKRATYQKAIISTINSDFMSEWRTSEEVAWEATKTIPRHWKQISVYVLGQILRPLIADGYIIKNKQANVSVYKRQKSIK